MADLERFEQLRVGVRSRSDLRWLIGPLGILAVAQHLAESARGPETIGDCRDLFDWLDDHCVASQVRPSERARGWLALGALPVAQRTGTLAEHLDSVAAAFPGATSLRGDNHLATMRRLAGSIDPLATLVEIAAFGQDAVLDDAIQAVFRHHRTIRREVVSVPFAVATRAAGEVLVLNVVRTYGQPSTAVDLQAAPFLESDDEFAAAIRTAWALTAPTLGIRWSVRFEGTGHPVERVTGPSVGVAAAVAMLALANANTRVDRGIVFTGRIEADGSIGSLQAPDGSDAYDAKVGAAALRTLVVPAPDVDAVADHARRMSRGPEIAGLAHVDGLVELLVRLDRGVRSPVVRADDDDIGPVTQSDRIDAFAGRASESNALVRTLSRPGYAPRLVLVTGGPGVGKTRLVSRCVELSAEARDVVTFVCDEPSSMRSEIIAALEHGRDRQAVVIDDAHLADTAVLDAVRRTISEVGAADLVVVMVLRDDGPLRDELRAFATDARRGHPLVTEIPLAALQVSEVLDLVSQVLIEYSDSECRSIADRLWAVCQGHALSTMLVLNIARQSKRSAVTERMLADGPGDLLDRIIRQSCALVPRSDVLTAAAILGVEFDYAGLRAVTQLDDDALLDSLATATEIRLVNDVAEVQDRYRFAHAMVRDVVLGHAARARVALMHARAAEYFAATMPDGPSRTAVLAHHYSEIAPAMHADRALEFTLAAAQDAAQARAFDDAESWFASAVEFATLGSTIEPLVVAQLGLGRTRRHRGDPSARAILLGACRRAMESGRHDLLASGVLAAHRGFFSRATAVDQEWVELIERALNVVTDPSSRAELLAVLASELTWADDGEPRFDLADEAIALALEHGSDRTVADIRYRRSLTIAALDTVGERDANSLALLELVDRMTEAGDVGPAAADELHFMAAITRATLAAEIGGMSEALGRVSDAETHAAAIGDAMTVFASRLARAGSLLTQGRLRLAASVSREALLIAESADQGGDAAMLHGEQMWEIRRLNGRTAPLRAEAGFIAGLPDPQIAVLGARYLADLGELDAARDAYERIRGGRFPVIRRGLTEPAVVRDLATLAIRFDDQASALALVDRLRPSADHFANTTVVRASGAHYLGGLSAILRRADETSYWYERAAALHEAQHAPMLLAETHIEWARSELHLGAVGAADRARHHIQIAMPLIDGAEAEGLRAVATGVLEGVG